MPTRPTADQQLDLDGFTILEKAVGDSHLVRLCAMLSRMLEDAEGDAGGIRSREGRIYAARNVLQLCPKLGCEWRQPALVDFVRDILGPDCGLVRILYFDKPPDGTWSLPWHKDLTVTIRPPAERSERFSRPTLRSGIPHAEAPLEVLEAMLTLRIHLDAATLENGPLQVIPGSHRSGKRLELELEGATPILTAAADVLAIRPLVAHCSGKSAPGCTDNRRVLHCEFAASPNLPDGYEWHTFIPVAT